MADNYVGSHGALVPLAELTRLAMATGTPRRLRVTRTLVFEGDAVWLNTTLERRWVKQDTPIGMGDRTVTETALQIEVLD